MQVSRADLHSRCTEGKSRQYATRIGDPPAAMTGTFTASTTCSKGGYRPEALFPKIGELIAMSPLRPTVPKSNQAPVWVPKNADGYFVVICADCLRSFSIPDEEAAKDLRKTECPFCGVNVHFLADPEKVKATRLASSVANLGDCLWLCAHVSLVGKIIPARRKTLCRLPG
jgi:hypothetical protein